MITNIVAQRAVDTSPSQAKFSKPSSPTLVSTPLSRPLDGSYIWLQISPMTIAGMTYGKNETTR